MEACEISGDGREQIVVGPQCVCMKMRHSAFPGQCPPIGPRNPNSLVRPIDVVFMPASVSHRPAIWSYKGAQISELKNKISVFCCLHHHCKQRQLSYSTTRPFPVVTCIANHDVFPICSVVEATNMIYCQISLSLIH